MRKLFAVWVTKFLVFLGKLSGKKGSSTPGKFALKICPDILKTLSGQVKKEIIVVCGTNGKTTTNNLLNSLVAASGAKTVCNNVGANMLPGVVTAFVANCDLLGRFSADYACIEVDEISTVRVFDHITPNCVVITNLFRDQLDRYGEIDITLDYLGKALKKCPDARLVLNADDPLVAAFGKSTGMECVYFGVGEDVGIALNETKEGRFCMFCGEELDYEYYHYSQLGMYSCPSCGFCRPDVLFDAKNVSLSNGIEFDLKGERISVKYRGFYNIYNILAAYSAASVLKVRLQNVNEVFSDYKPQTGRMEEFKVGGKQVIFNLSKNPAGFNQAISTVMVDKRRKNIVTVINDNAQDGKDISWIWDVDFERFLNVNGNEFVVSGIRHNDLAVRFKYAEILNVSDVSDVKKAIEKALDGDAEVIYVLVNYTALFSTHDILKSMEDDYEA